MTTSRETRHASSSLGSLAPYVPSLIARHFADSVFPPTEPISKDFPAAVLIADLSGFTPLTEALARRGDRGAEVVQEILDSCFNKLIELVADQGGEVVNFAGDATIAVWPATDGESLESATRHAAQCALAI